MNVGVIIGAAAPPGRVRALASLLADRLRSHQPALVVDVIDLAEVAFAAADGRPISQYDSSMAVAVQKVLHARCVLIVSPVYRGTYTGILKNFLDILPVEGLRGKPVGLAVVGGTPHHYLGVDVGLRPVLAWFGALALPTSVYLTSADFDNEKRPRTVASHELEELVEALLDLAGAVLTTKLGPKPLASRSR